MTSKPLPAADLSEAFGKPSRAAGLRLPATRPTRPRRQAVQAVPATDEGETPHAPDNAQEMQGIAAGAGVELRQDADEPRTRQPPGRPRRGRPPRRNVEVGRPDAGRGRLVLWTPVSIRARMQAVRTRTGTLYLDQVLDALESSHDHLIDLVHQATSRPQVQGPLFERTGPSEAEDGERRVQLTIGGILESQLRVIDQLVEQTGAPSRSALVNAALAAVLPNG